MERSKSIATRTGKTGLPPGTLMHVGERKEDAVIITRFDYGPDGIHETAPATIEACLAMKTASPVTWINVEGLHQVDVIEKIGLFYSLDPLSQEDVLTTMQRPKAEDNGDYILIIVKMLFLEQDSHRVRTEQVSIILGNGYVVSFQESREDVFGAVRKRLKGGKGRIRKMGADYLAYALLDTLVDNYFVLLERFGERIEALEDELEEKPDRKTLQAIHELRRENIFLRKSIWPLRELVSALDRSESELLSGELDRYLRDLYDHTIQIIEIVETNQDLITGMLDLYLSSVSNRMNEVMKVLTMFASIFIPLTFIAGIYGMNFKFMPELTWRWSYPLVWLFMVSGALGMLFFFKRRGWF